jgi:hypothetical protein
VASVGEPCGVYVLGNLCRRFYIGPAWTVAVGVGEHNEGEGAPTKFTRSERDNIRRGVSSGFGVGPAAACAS